MEPRHTKNLLQTVIKGYTNNPLGFIPVFIMLVYAAIMLILYASLCSNNAYSSLYTK